MNVKAPLITSSDFLSSADPIVLSTSGGILRDVDADAGGEVELTLEPKEFAVSSLLSTGKRAKSRIR